MYLLGIDIGTTGCKSVVFDIEGNEVAKSYRSYPLLIPNEGWRELNPDTVIESVFATITECASNGVGRKISALSASAQGEAMVAVSREGTPLCNSMVSFDIRNHQEAQWIRDNMNIEYIAERTGVPQHTMFSASKLLWIKNHRPDVWEKTWKFMCFGDYLAFKLGATPVMDSSSASRTMLYDIKDKCWNKKIVSEMGLSIEKLPEVRPCGVLIGKINKNVAEMLGINSDAAIVTGGHDQVCCGLGAGVLENGVAMNSMGTTDTLLSVSDRFFSGSRQIETNIPCGCYSLDNMYANHSFVLTTGAMLQWFRDKLYGGNYKYSELEEMARYENSPSGIFVMPHFSGSGTPQLDSSSKGVIIGLSLETKIGDLHKACLEGNCYEMKINLRNMEQSGISIDNIRCIGGGAQSDLYLQIKANIMRKPIIRLSVDEAGCLGAALLAGIGCGVVSSEVSALKKYAAEQKVFSPDPSLEAEYEDLFGRYIEIYKNNKKIFQ